MNDIVVLIFYGNEIFWCKMVFDYVKKWYVEELESFRVEVGYYLILWCKVQVVVSVLVRIIELVVIVVDVDCVILGLKFVVWVVQQGVVWVMLYLKVYWMGQVVLKYIFEGVNFGLLIGQI